MDQLAAAMAQLAQAIDVAVEHITKNTCTHEHLSRSRRYRQFFGHLWRYEWLHQIQQGEWVAYLIPKLQGTIRDSCAGLTYTETYMEVKEVLRKRFNVTKGGSRQSLRNLKFNNKMTLQEYVVQAMPLTMQSMVDTRYNSVPGWNECKKERLAEGDSGRNVTCYNRDKLGHCSTVPREGSRIRRSYGQRNLCIPVYWDNERYHYQWNSFGYWQYKDISTLKICVWSNEDVKLPSALKCQWTED